MSIQVQEFSSKERALAFVRRLPLGTAYMLNRSACSGAWVLEYEEDRP